MNGENDATKGLTKIQFITQLIFSSHFIAKVIVDAHFLLYNYLYRVDGLTIGTPGLKETKTHISSLLLL